MEITKANEDYLESILVLGTIKDGTRSVDVAKSLGVSKAAVTIAVEELITKGLVIREAYRNIFLTDAGRTIATSISQKHKLIKDFLIKIGVSEETADIECCKIEHILSDETLACLQKVATKF
ncbi:MAG: iron dependent repressor, metal binding and dimerization domain protein [Bacillota bacterium]